MRNKQTMIESGMSEATVRLFGEVSSEGFLVEAGLRENEIRYLQEYKEGVDVAEIYGDGLGEIWRQVEKRPDAENDFRFVAGQWAAFLSQRGLRALELRSPEVREAAEIALKLHGMKVFITECLDGRNAASIIFGHVPGVMGGSHRTDAGKVEYDDKRGILDRMGTFYLMVKSVLSGTNGRHCQAMGAHLGCAAKDGETYDRYVAGDVMKSRDKGFAYNVARKRLYVEALRAVFGDQVVPFEYNYDPHEGGVRMFAEGDRVNEYLDANDPYRVDGLTTEVLAELEEMGLIASSWGLFEELKDDQDFRTIINRGYAGAQQNGGEFDWVENYAKTALAFWQSVKAFWENDKLQAVVTDRVQLVARNHGIELGEDELRLRSLLLIEAMLQTTFVTNFRTKEWRHSEHVEKFMKLSQTEGPAPFRDTAFLYTGEDMRGLGDYVKLMVGVIRDVRVRLGWAPAEVLRPMLLFNVFVDAEEQPSPRAQVAGQKLLADKWGVLSRHKVTGEMIRKGNLVVLNLLKAKGKQVREVMRAA